MAHFPGFAPPGAGSNRGDVGMADANEDDESSSSTTTPSMNSSVSRTADQFRTALRISPPKLSIPNPIRNYFAISAVVDPTFSAPPLPSTDDDDMMVTSSSSRTSGPPQVLPMTPVYFPPPAAPSPAPAAAPPPSAGAPQNYQLETTSTSSLNAPPSRAPQVDTTRPKPPARKKVPLEKGYSQMVWLRLMQTEPDLPGLKGESPRRLLTMDEIRKHKSEGEAWTVLAGRVYNITPYLKFHPGGAEMLMKAAGRDGTALFNKYHAWVNAEFLMEKCMVGLLDVQGQADK